MDTQITPDNQPVQPQTTQQAQPQPEVQPQPIQQTEPAHSADPGFISLTKASLRVFGQNWKVFAKMAVILLIPIIIVIIALSALGIKIAHAAPKLPNAEQVIQTQDIPAVSQPEATAPGDTPIADTTDTQTVSDTATAQPADGVQTVIAPADSTATPETTSADTSAQPISSDAPEAQTDAQTEQPETAESSDEAMMVVDPNAASKIALPLLGAVAGGIAIVLIILFIPFMLYIMIASIAMMKLVVTVAQGQEVKNKEIIKWAIKKIFSYIALGIRSAIYIAWPVLAVSILIAILTIAGIQFPMMNLVMFGVGVAGFVMAVIRAPRVSFAKFILAEKDCPSKEALQTSISAATGHWGKIIINMVLISLLIGISSGIINSIFTKINGLLGTIVGVIVAAAAACIAMIFYYGLYNICRMMNENK